MDTLCHNCVVQVEKDVFRLIKLAETKAHSGVVESADGIKVSALAAAAYSSALFLVGVRRVCLFEVKLVQAGHGASNSQLVANSKAGCWRSIKAKRCVIFLNPKKKKKNYSKQYKIPFSELSRESHRLSHEVMRCKLTRLRKVVASRPGHVT